MYRACTYLEQFLRVPSLFTLVEVGQVCTVRASNLKNSDVRGLATSPPNPGHASLRARLILSANAEEAPSMAVAEACNWSKLARILCVRMSRCKLAGTERCTHAQNRIRPVPRCLHVLLPVGHIPQDSNCLGRSITIGFPSGVYCSQPWIGRRDR